MGAMDEHERTITFAEIALDQIKALRQPASPRYFEVWYSYVTGYNPALNQAINDKLARQGTLREADIDEVYQRYLSPARLDERMSEVGNHVVDEIEQVMGLIMTAAGDASSYSESLHEVSQKLGSGLDAPALRALVEGLVRATKQIERNNRALEARLFASKQEITQLQENLQAVRHESLTDPLTLLANRKCFDQSLARAITEARRRAAPMSLMLGDVDHFKKFNDNYGHLTGDQVLRLVAMSMKASVREQDIAARYGGEEFAVVLPDTGLPGAVRLGNEIRLAVIAKELKKRSTRETLGRVTLSIGVATLRPSDTIQSLIERADACLYAAKRNGRNQVVSETDLARITVAEVA